MLTKILLLKRPFFSRIPPLVSSSLNRSSLAFSWTCLLVKDFDTTSVLFIYVCMYVLKWSSNARES